MKRDIQSILMSLFPCECYSTLLIPSMNCTFSKNLLSNNRRHDCYYHGYGILFSVGLSGLINKEWSKDLKYYMCTAHECMIYDRRECKEKDFIVKMHSDLKAVYERKGTVESGKVGEEGMEWGRKKKKTKPETESDRWIDIKR